MTLLVPSRRGVLGGLLGLVASPAIVRATSLMSISPAQQSIVLRVIRPQEDWSLLTLRKITREGVELFKTSNTFIQDINEQFEKDFQFAKSNAKDGFNWRI